MKNVSFYEQTGIVIPGSVLLFGLIIVAPNLRAVFDQGGITIGVLGLFVLVAYAAGHGIAAFGNLIETVWWWMRGGIPTDWVIGKSPRLLHVQQLNLLQVRIAQRLGVPNLKLHDLARKEWSPIFGQMYRDVLLNNPGRVEVFNGNYGLNRGLAAALIVLAAAVACTTPTQGWVAIALLVAAGIYLYRMQRFGIHFAREVFSGFLNLPAKRPISASTK